MPAFDDIPRRVVLVHGFNVTDGGRDTIDRLAPLLARSGYIVDTDGADYGYFGLLAIRFFGGKRKRAVLDRLMRAFVRADVIITHSNGANFATQALNRFGPGYMESKLVIHISPALNKKTRVPQAVKRMLVMHTPHDLPVWLSSLLLFHPWGKMGKVGYKGKDDRVENREFPQVKGHSDWFQPSGIRQTWLTCLNFITRNAT